MAFTQTMRVMRLTAILLLAGLLQVSARTHAQNITLSARSLPLEKVFSEIRKQTGYEFLYNVFLLQKALPVDLEVRNAPVAEVLDRIFAGQPFSYSIIDEKTIVVREKKEEKPEPNLLPPGDVHGRVTDSTGAPLSGASITVKGTRHGVETDKDGYFILKEVQVGTTIVISFTGFASKEYKIGGSGDINVSLARSTSPLDVVQVIPYGTTTARLNVGSIATVTSKEIEEQPVTSVLEALEGRVPGLVITQNTGLPGGSFKVLIRGQNSILNGTDPYYVIDGVPYNSQLPTAPLNLNLTGGSPLNYLNPYDIESIEVLKDADATAIYGSKAANGAILITTKKGKAGIMHFDLNMSTGFTTPARTIQELNTNQYLMMRHEAFANDAKRPGLGDYDINGVWDTTRNVDWAKIMTNKPAQYTDFEGTVSGGNTNIQYLIGGGYNIQKTGSPSLLPGDGGNKRTSLHCNLNSSSANKRFRLSLTASYSSTKNTVQSTDFTDARLLLVPDAPPLFNSDGTLNWAPKVPGQVGTWVNPYAILYASMVNNTGVLSSNLDLSYNLAKGLEIRTSMGYGFLHAEGYYLLPTTSYDPGRMIPSGNSTFNSGNSTNWITEPQLNYRLQVGKGVISALVGATFQESNTNSSDQLGNGFISDALLGDLGAASSVQASTNAAQNKYEAYFGRLNFDWADKYILNLNGRRDGTTRFGPGRLYGNFGSVGAGWIFTKETFFMKSLNFLSFGKLRGSYGITGSDQIGDYQYLSLYGLAGSIPYQGYQGLAPESLFNTDLQWETTSKMEIGLELGFWHDRVTLQASIYGNRTNNQLVQTPLSYVTGFNQVESNLPALVQNSGKEFTLNAAIIKTKTFNWGANFNIAVNSNKLLAFPGLNNSPYAGTYFIGKSLNTAPVIHYMGVNDTTGLYQVETVGGGTTSKLEPNIDRSHYIDKLKGAFDGGFGSNFSYKGFSLNLFFQFRKQVGPKLWTSYPQIPGVRFNQPLEVLDRWQKPGDKKPFEKFTESKSSAAARAFSLATSSDYAYGDASFARLKTVALSWQMPETLARKIGFRSFGISVNAQNLLTFTRYDGADPETLNITTGPRRTASAGIQIGL